MGEDAIAAAGFVLVVLAVVATVAVLLVTFLV